MQAETALDQSKEHNHELETKLEQTRKVCIRYLAYSYFSGFGISLDFDGGISLYFPRFATLYFRQCALKCRNWNL